jgi:hypothetical protein
MMPKPVTLWIPLGDDKAAKVQVAIVERGLGAIDPDREREPALSEMDEVSNALQRRAWKKTNPL